MGKSDEGHSLNEYLYMCAVDAKVQTGNLHQTVIVAVQHVHDDRCLHQLHGPHGDHYDGYKEQHDHHQHPTRG